MTTPGTDPGDVGPGEPFLAEFLRTARDEIFAAWERALRPAPEMQGLSDQQLRNRIPEVLDRTAEVVQSIHTGEPVSLAELPDLHASDRLETGLDLLSIARELSLLRTIALDLWRSRMRDRLPARVLEEVQVFDGAIDELMARSVEHYASVRLGVQAELVQRERSATHEWQRALEALEYGDPFFLLDAGWHVVIVNASFERTTGKPRAEALGRVFWEVWPETRDPAASYWREFHRCMEERVPVQFEEFFRPLRMWTEVTAYPAADGGIAVFVRDVSARKRAEARARQAEEALHERERQRANFEQQLIGIVSHDLRSPLHAILLSSEVLLRRTDLDTRTAAAALRIESAAARAMALIRDLLDFTRARMVGGIPLSLERIDLHAHVRAAAEEVRAEFPDRQISYEQSGGAELRCDPARIAQVVTNLVSNAFKYGAADAPVVLRTHVADRWVRLEVHNEGPPIAAELMPHLFEPLRQGRPGGEVGGARGVGLGLYIVDHVVRAHGGAIEVLSAAGEGTTFVVRLPREPPAAIAPAPGGETGE